MVYTSDRFNITLQLDYSTEIQYINDEFVNNNYILRDPKFNIYTSISDFLICKVEIFFTIRALNISNFFRPRFIYKVAKLRFYARNSSFQRKR